jgi:regulator of protease activity HflC (stomatin/prohibitin superfamily)
MSQFMFAIIFSVIVSVAVAVAIYNLTARRPGSRPNVRMATTVAVAAFFIAMVGVSIPDSFVQVEAGTVAVVKQFGRVVNVFTPGLNFKIPFVQDVIVYRTQEIIYETSADPASSRADYPDFEVDTATSDGQQIRARFTVRVRIDGIRAADILQNLGDEKEMVEKVVKANARVRVRNILKRFQAADLYSGNVEAAEQAISEQLKEDYGHEGIELVFFGLRSIQFSDAYKQAVENKQIEAENIATKENLAKQARFEKDRIITQAEAEAERQRLERIGVAEGQAQATKLQAEAEAEAILAKAKAQAEANRLISSSLTPEMIAWQAAITWNGSYPTVMGTTGQFILPGDLFTQTPSLETAPGQ